MLINFVVAHLEGFINLSRASPNPEFEPKGSAVTKFFLIFSVYVSKSKQC